MRSENYDYGQAQSLVTGKTKRYTEETQGPTSLR